MDPSVIKSHVYMYVRKLVDTVGFRNHWIK